MKILLVIWRALKLIRLKDSRLGEWILEKYYSWSPSYQFWATVLALVLIGGYLLW